MRILPSPRPASRQNSRSLFAALLALVLAALAHAQIPTWPKTTPADVTAAGIDVQLTGADYGNGTFVLAAYFGGTTAVPAVRPAVYTSPDGTTWTPRNLPVTGARVSKPRFLNGKFYLGMDAATNSNGVPTGTNGAVLSSADGINWTATTLSAPLYGPSSFSYGNNLFVAPVSGVTGASFQVVTSPDGVTWTPRAIGGGANFVSSVAFFKGKFYAADYSAGTFSSPDGVTWTKVPGAPAGGNIVTATDSALLITWNTGATQHQSLSADGATFATAAPGQSLSFDSMPVVNGAFATAVGINASSSDQTQVVASSDGNTWATIATTANHYSAADLAYGGGHWVFVGEFDAFAGATTITPGGVASGGSSGGSGGSGGTIPTTVAELSASALAGATLNFTIAGGNSPFESSGDFSIVLDTPTAGQYSVAVSSGNVGPHRGAFTYVVNAEGAKLVLADYLAGQDGVNLNLYAAGTATANATSGAGKSFFEMNTFGANKHGTFTIAGGSGSGSGGGGATPAPTIGTQPASQTVALGGDVTFTVVASGTGLNYQWYFNGAAINGEIGASLILSAIDALRAGVYTVIITNGGGEVTSYAAKLTLATASTSGRITNMSVRASAGAGDQTLIVGVVVGGAGTSGHKDLLFRAAGPSLSGFGVANFLADPKLTAFAGSSSIDSNDNWAGDATLLAVAARVGAFGFASASSKDSAIYASPDAGAYSLHVTGGTSGIALAEIYDATETFTDASPRLINVSARAQVGTGDNLLIAGFVIGGSTPRTVLIRALGPTLASRGVTGVLADPKIAVYSSGVKVAENDNWSDATNAAAVVTASAQVGATALASGSKDAVLLVTLNPGIYTALVTGVGNTTGVALVELFEAQ